MARAAAVAMLGVLVAACSTVAPSRSNPEPASPPTPAITVLASSPRPSLDAPTSGPSPAPAAAATADVAISPDIPVVYADTPASLSVWAFIVSGKTGPSGQLAVASATIDFGDGTSGTVSQGCASPAERLALRHVYRAPAEAALSVRAATLCDSGWRLDLDAGEGIRILPAADPGTAAWPMCTTFQLRMTDGGTGAGLGNVVTLVRVTNVSKAGCNVRGHPDLRLVSATGALLATHVRQATDGDYMFAPMAVGRIALAPGDIAAFEIGYGDNPAGSGPNEPYDVACPPARWLRVILPWNHQYGTATVATAPCEGFINVSPLYPGRDRIGFP